MKKEVKTFLIIYLECFFILLLFGEILPKIIEQVLYYYYNNPELHKNSILVGSEIKVGSNFIYNYMRIFKLFIR